MTDDELLKMEPIDLAYCQLPPHRLEIAAQILSALFAGGMMFEGLDPYKTAIDHADKLIAAEEKIRNG